MQNNPQALFELSVLEEYDGTYGVWIARCLQTGSVVSADDQETVRQMMLDVLEDEIAFAIQHNNLKNLWSPAPLDVWFRWDALAAIQPPEEVRLRIQTRKPAAPSEVSSVIRTARAA